MKYTGLHLAMREMHRFMRGQKAQAALIATGILVGLAGPFGTESAMRLAPRVLYWLVVVQVTFASGTLVSAYIANTHMARRLPGWASAALAGLLIGLVVSIEIFAFNWAIFNISPFEQSYFLPLFINTLVVSVVVRMAIAVVLNEQPAPHKTSAPIAQPNPDSGPAPQDTPLLARLPFDKRGAIISLSVKDHYVDVTTTSGTEMILIRLADAIREAGDGFQVHRSHWVAREHVTAVRRDGAKAVIKTSDGRDIPVSRTYVPVLKEAGFLP
ncbi:LytTR family transcriptional regulator [Pacificibacter maritimus]|uniref:LytTR family transcriptional regulator n=1 Tax=Pacificibacter maritimus TaxID=762213 RepID=A0A3N4UPC9_9RHOB|nr:LytTR family DNA-binding domain-containing protein [Pacificibacter maritimus]RPE71888.1 LytTR family transcriptional regulator [Pacificibacter maritimus]